VSAQHGIVEFRRLLYLHHYRFDIIGVWCNESTLDFESSSPRLLRGIPTRLLYIICRLGVIGSHAALRTLSGRVGVQVPQATREIGSWFDSKVDVVPIGHFPLN
jgi:hypothetical protein